MTNQELIASLAKRLKWTQKQTSEMMNVTVSIINAKLIDGDSINIQGFGIFDTKKKNERISVNPISKQKFLVPPKIVVNFRPSQNFKETLKEIDSNE